MGECGAGNEENIDLDIGKMPGMLRASVNRLLCPPSSLTSLSRLLAWSLLAPTTRPRSIRVMGVPSLSPGHSRAWLVQLGPHQFSQSLVQRDFEWLADQRMQCPQRMTLVLSFKCRILQNLRTLALCEVHLVYTPRHDFVVFSIYFYIRRDGDGLIATGASTAVSENFPEFASAFLRVLKQSCSPWVGN